MIRAGRLMTKIVIQSPTESRTSDGGSTTTWADYCTCMAEKIDLSGREFFAARQINAELTTRFSIRQRTDLTQEMRIVTGGLNYAVTSPPIQIGKDETQLLTRVLNG